MNIYEIAFLSQYFFLSEQYYTALYFYNIKCRNKNNNLHAKKATHFTHPK